MVFTENNHLVQFYVRKIKDSNGAVTIDDVPNLYNLKDVVETLLKI